MVIGPLQTLVTRKGPLGLLSWVFVGVVINPISSVDDSPQRFCIGPPLLKSTLKGRPIDTTGRGQ